MEKDTQLALVKSSLLKGSLHLRGENPVLTDAVPESDYI